MLGCSRLDGVTICLLDLARELSDGVGVNLILPMKTQEDVWVKWYAKTPEGYERTGVYCPSSDSYLCKPYVTEGECAESQKALEEASNPRQF